MNISVINFLAERMDLLRGYMIFVTPEECLTFLLDTIQIPQVFLFGIAHILANRFALTKDTSKPLLGVISLLINMINPLGLGELVIIKKYAVALIYLTRPPPPPTKKNLTQASTQ